MKKITFAIAIMMLAAASVYAGDYTSAPGAQITGNVTGGGVAQISKLSTNVSADMKYDKTSYTAVTKHASGTKEYGSSSASTSLYSKDNATLEAPTASDSSNFNTGWTSL